MVEIDIHNCLFIQVKIGITRDFINSSFTYCHISMIYYCDEVHILSRHFNFCHSKPCKMCTVTNLCRFQGKGMRFSNALRLDNS